MTGERFFIGLHAGGLDSVDAVLVAVRGCGEKMEPRQLQCLHVPLGAAIRTRAELLPADFDACLSDLSELDDQVASAMGAAADSLLAQAGAAKKDISAVGVLGLRIASGLELGLPAGVARRLKLPVVGRFDIADRAAGGNGGAVTAWPAWRMLRDKRLSRTLVHLGEIASVTFVGSGAAECEVVAYDLGPGTILLDELARRALHPQRRRPRPCAGRGSGVVSRGKANQALLNELLAQTYFHRPPPKITWRGFWTGEYLNRLEFVAEKHDCRGADLLATAVELTVRLVAGAVGKFTERPHEVVLCGGGAEDARLFKRIRSIMSPCSTYLADRYGLGVRVAPAVFAAILAAAKLDGFPAHIPSASGAARRLVLGNLATP